MKTLKFLRESAGHQDRLHYLFHLRTLPVGFWTLDQRKEYLGYWMKDKQKLSHTADLLSWFAQAGRGYGDSSSYANFLKNFLKEYVANMAECVRTVIEVRESYPDDGDMPSNWWSPYASHGSRYDQQYH